MQMVHKHDENGTAPFFYTKIQLINSGNVNVTNY